MSLAELLLASVQPAEAVRKHAEETLKQVEMQAGFLTSLLQLVAVPETDPSVRQAGAIYFKNTVNRRWDPSGDHIVSAEDKAWIKLHIIQAISTSSPLIRSQLLAALTTIIAFDFRLESLWPEIIPTVKSMIASDQRNIVFSGLLVFLEIIKNFQWVGSKERSALHPVLRELLPMALAVATNLKPHITTSVEAVEMLKCIIKAYSCSIRLDITRKLQQGDCFLRLGSLGGTLFLEILEDASCRLVPTTNIAFGMKRIARSTFGWKLKKWACQCLNTLFGRYGSTKPEKRYLAFSKMFVANFAPKILESVLRQVDLCVQGVWMSNRVKQHLAKFLDYSVRRKVTWAIMLQRLDTIVGQFIFPLLCFSKEDDELWHDNPVDYIHKKIDPTIEDFKSPVVASSELLLSICKDRFKQAFVPTVTIINTLLDKYNQTPVEQRDPRHKYGVLNMMGCIVEQCVSKESPISASMEMFLVAHVVPDLASTFPPLRARACDTLLKFASEMEISDTNLPVIFNSLLACFKDPELPVRVEAALSLAPFFTYPNIREAMKPHAAEIMQGLLNMTNEIDMDTLTHVMEQLVFEYSAELTPFAVQLATQLCETFGRIIYNVKLDADNDEMDDLEEKTIAAVGVLKTIASLILSVEGSASIVLEVENIVLPHIKYIIENNILDLFEEALEILETLPYCSKTITPGLWSLLPVVYASFKSDGFDFFESMMPAIQFFIMYGKDQLSQTQELQEMLFDIASQLIFTKGVSETDRVRACQLVELMLLYLRGSIDRYLPKFVEMAHKMLVQKPAKHPALRVHALELVINCMFYNAGATLQLLEQAQWTAGFFDIWFNSIDDLTRVHDKRLSILTLIDLLELPAEQYPAALQASWTHLFDGVVKIFGTYPAAIEARQKEQRIADGEEEDDEEAVEEEGYDQGDYVSDDEEGETLESLAGEAAQYRKSGEGRFVVEEIGAGEQEDEEEDDFENWGIETMMYEDVFFTTYLDEIDAYEQFENLMRSMAENGKAAVLESRLSAEQKQIVSLIIKAGQEERAKRAIQQAAAAAAAAASSSAANSAAVHN